MIKPGDIISHMTMCQEEGLSLQRGMNFHLNKSYSVILMSRRKDAKYTDEISENGKVLIYEGHNVSRRYTDKDPKTLNQPMNTPNGSLTQNGKFYKSVESNIKDQSGIELAKVYEKLYPGIWVYNGTFKLIEAFIEKKNKRNVFKFKFELIDSPLSKQVENLDHNRIIPSNIKQQVWNRDKGKCVICGKNDNLHFDHIIPYSKGGSSLVTKNIQILCARHNLSKHDKII